VGSSMFGRYSQVFADAVLRNDRLARWNDRLSFWWVGAIFGWAAFGVLLFWPILHLGFGPRNLLCHGFLKGMHSQS
jgi:hypothetical protein